MQMEWCLTQVGESVVKHVLKVWNLSYCILLSLSYIYIGCQCPIQVDGSKKICGMDGKDYKTGCDADCKGVQIECKGSCPCKMSCNCTSEKWQPVCGEDGLTYISPCRATCEKVKVLCLGACPCKQVRHQTLDVMMHSRGAGEATLK